MDHFDCSLFPVNPGIVVLEPVVVKTLNLTVEYVFQLEAYIYHLISSRSLLEDPVKVFSEVISEERCRRDFE